VSIEKDKHSKTKARYRLGKGKYQGMVTEKENKKENIHKKGKNNTIEASPATAPI
jgi:hypothetical protein